MASEKVDRFVSKPEELAAITVARMRMKIIAAILADNRHTA